MKKIALFGGTFDPIHFGHLNLAMQMQELYQFDALYFIPAYLNPHKEQCPSLVSPEHRLEMVQIAIQGIAHFHVSDIEVKREGISYTIDTVRAFKKQFEGADIFWILADDVAVSLGKWKEIDALVQLCTILIGSRTGKVSFEGCSEKVKEALKKGATDTQILEISSTDLRERLKKKLYCGHLVPSPVLDYIAENGLY